MLSNIVDAGGRWRRERRGRGEAERGGGGGGGEEGGEEGGGGGGGGSGENASE